MSLATTTSEPLPQTALEQTELFPMSSVGDSHAKTSAWRGGGQGSTKIPVADYGQNTPVLLAKYDHNTSSWRTSQHCLEGGLSAFSETWPRSGMTRSGTAYQLPPLVRLTDGIASGLLPTPAARDWKDNGTSPAELNRNSVTLATIAGGYLNPTWVEWLMGFPTDHTALNASETPSSRKSQKSSGGQ